MDLAAHARPLGDDQRELVLHRAQPQPPRRAESPAAGLIRQSRVEAVGLVERRRDGEIPEPRLGPEAVVGRADAEAVPARRNVRERRLAAGRRRPPTPRSRPRACTDSAASMAADRLSVAVVHLQRSRCARATRRCRSTASGRPSTTTRSMRGGAGRWIRGSWPRIDDRRAGARRQPEPAVAGANGRRAAVPLQIARQTVGDVVEPVLDFVRRVRGDLVDLGRVEPHQARTGVHAQPDVTVVVFDERRHDARERSVVRASAS